jgi:hypothetical protein
MALGLAVNAYNERRGLDPQGRPLPGMTGEGLAAGHE